MRVLQVSHTAKPGGSNSVLLSLIRHAPGGVTNACVFLEDGVVAEQARALGVPTSILPSGRARQVWLAPGVVRGLRAAVRQHRADAVLAHVNKAHVYAGAAARLEGVPAAWWQHEHLQLKPLLQRVASRVPAEAVICSADWIAEEQRRHTRAPVHVVHPGVEAGATAGEPRLHLAGQDGMVVLGVVGRLARWKRWELAVRALPLVRAAIPGVRMRIIGGAGADADRGYGHELEAEIARLGLTDVVEVAGHVDDVPTAIRELDVVVHPAEREPWGLVVLEALAAGVPVVASAEGGPCEILRAGIDGVLVDPRDRTKLAAALVELAADPASRARMGAAGRERVLSDFTAERAAGRFWQVMRGVSRRRRSRIRR